MSCGSTKDGPSQMGGLWEIWWRRLQWRGEGATTPKSDTFMPRGLCEAPCPCVASCLWNKVRHCMVSWHSSELGFCPIKGFPCLSSGIDLFIFSVVCGIFFVELFEADNVVRMCLPHLPQQAITPSKKRSQYFSCVCACVHTLGITYRSWSQMAWLGSDLAFP